MDEDENLVGLKKAYASIILNTGKEAATRIMISEQKAFRFQQELSSTKEESLNMLLRLKQMTDFKIAELEVTCFSQRRRIEELEGELHKTKGTVFYLREQVKGVQNELEKKKSNEVPRSDEVKERGLHRNIVMQVNEPATPDSVLSLLPDSRSESTKGKPLDQRNIEDNCHNVSKSATVQPEPLITFQSENCYVGNPDLDSVVMGSKEPEPYRNGCTQRIRAIERNMLNSVSPLPAQADDQSTVIKNESISTEEEIGEDVGAQPSSQDETVRKKTTGVEETLQQDSSGDNSTRCFHKVSAWKKKPRCGPAKSNSCSNQVAKGCKPPLLSRCKTYPYPETSEDVSATTEDNVQKTSKLPVLTLSETDATPQLVCVDGTVSDRETMSSSAQNTVKEDNVLIDKLDLKRHEREVADSSGVPKCKLNLKTVTKLSMNDDSVEKKECEKLNDIPSQIVNDKPLMYTFRRKRKKGTFNCSGGNEPIEKNTAKKRSGEKQSVAPEPQKSSLIIESSRDSRRLAQVARQLISLSEKRWWS